MDHPSFETSSKNTPTTEVYDIIIVGAGPAGLSAAINAHKSHLNYVLLEKSDHIADTIYCYPKGKPVMAEPSVIPILGDMWMEAASREVVLEQWHEVAEKFHARILF